MPVAGSNVIFSISFYDTSINCEIFVTLSEDLDFKLAASNFNANHVDL
jgi:hypothetical protein